MYPCFIYSIYIHSGGNFMQHFQVPVVPLWQITRSDVVFNRDGIILTFKMSWILEHLDWWFSDQGSYNVFTFFRETKLSFYMVCCNWHCLTPKSLFLFISKLIVIAEISVTWLSAIKKIKKSAKLWSPQPCQWNKQNITGTARTVVKELLMCHIEGNTRG